MAIQIEILKEITVEKPYLVIYKPKGLPSAPLSADDTENALAQAAAMYPQIKSVCGKKPIEYGLLHRLDTATDGLLLIATSQECYDFLCQEQREGRFIKTYTAQCDILPDNADLLGAFPPLRGAQKNSSLRGAQKNSSLRGAPATKQTMSSYFRPYGQGRKEVRPVTEESGKAALSKLGSKKLYTTKIEIKKLSDTKAWVVCEISEGYRHQVRCHLAWAGYPVCGDLLYNSKNRQSVISEDKKKAENLLFSATSISFEYPRGDLNSYDRKDTWT